MKMSERQLRQRAISRAIVLGLAGEVERVQLGWYQVPSSTTPRTVYTVRVVGTVYACSCDAGRSGRPSVHAAAVFIRKTEASGATVVAPAAPPLANVITLRPASLARTPRKEVAL